ncbi:sensor histidine kinase [Aurantiacibacter flavus]|uniref:histidine kinase n=1 Tax=Aurantiacibacter flavus TaxID=3145232 RepID=A0ABV0CWZ7_9SPHN
MNLFLWLEVLAAVSLVAMLGAAWFYLTGRSDPDELVPSVEAAMLLVGTLIPALTLVVLWGRRIAIRRAGGTTARLHVNMVFFFSLVAAIPTLIVAVFASLLFQSGVEFWFSSDSRGIMENANRVAEGFYNENQLDVGNNTTAMAVDLRYFLEEDSVTSPEFEEFFGLQVYYRELNESAILQLAPDGTLRTAAIVDPQDDPDRVRVTPATIERLQSGEPVVINATPERVEAVSTLDADLGVYLYAARNSDPDVMALYSRAENVVSDYDALIARMRSLQLRYNLALFAMSLALVGIAVWAALRFADRQVKPLAELAAAAREIGSGNYAIRVDGRTGPDEIGLLNRAFNRMSQQIERQTDALIGANHQLDERRTFIEAVLQSITAGIISVDPAGKVLLMNQSAQELVVSGEGEPPIGAALADVAPQFAELVESGKDSGILQISRDNELLTLAVKLTRSAGGPVITFEDITRQLLDQRQAAWSDVARRIAHEIKNPLTPIQLATERLKRRYGRQIEQDVELFDELTGTIIRQVGDLRKMVDEFSSFARLPKPVFRPEDPLDLARQALFLQEVAHPEITYTFQAADAIPHIACDRHQFGQAMTNVLKNACEAIDARRRDAPIDWRGRVEVEVSLDGQTLQIDVCDNGIGLPQGRDNIIEPYVTTREKGTGLGLAIVKKIVEEHGGDLSFCNLPEGGAKATLRFAVDPAAPDRSPDNEAVE